MWRWLWSYDVPARRRRDHLHPGAAPGGVEERACAAEASQRTKASLERDMEGGAALRGALGASCGGRDCCAHGGGGAAAAGGAVGGWEASPGGAGGAHHAAGGLWRDSLPWLCDLGDGAGEPLREGGLEGGDAFFAALASCGAGGASPAGGPLGEADLDGWLCKHVHTTAPSEQPGGAPQTTCHHTHVRVCKPQRARRGASGGGGPAASKAHAPQPQPQPGASRAEAPKNEGSAGDTAAAAEDGESSGGDDAPLERKRCAFRSSPPCALAHFSPPLTRPAALFVQQPRGRAQVPRAQEGRGGPRRSRAGRTQSASGGALVRQRAPPRAAGPDRRPRGGGGLPGAAAAAR